MALAVTVVACGSSNGTSASGASSFPLRQQVDVPLSGKSSRYDYQSIDPGRKLLFLANLGGGQLTVFDTGRQTVIREIGGLVGAHGVLAVPSLGRVYVTATGQKEVVSFDEGTGKILWRTPAGRFPDGIAYDPTSKRIFVSDASGDQVVAVDALSGRKAGSIALGGAVGNVQYDPVTKKIFVDQSRNQLVEIDPRKLRITRRVVLPGCNNDHGLLIDTEARLAFIACDQNARLLALDLKTMKIRSKSTVGKQPDVLAFDTGMKRLYVASESGTVSIFHEKGKKLVKIGQRYLAKNAHSVAVDSGTHLVYFPLADPGGSPVLRIMAP